MRQRHGRTRGVVAQSADGRLVGAAWVSVDRCRLGADVVPSVLLHSLAVHPQWRRMGIAKALTSRRLAIADESGPGAVVIAGIQVGNSGSMANTRSWATETLSPLVVTPVPMRRRPPANLPGVTVREAVPADAARIAACLAETYDGSDLGPPYTPEFVESWLGREYAGSPMSHYLVAADASGRLLAGIGVEHQPRLMTLHVESLPRSIALINLLVRVVPADREMRNLPVVMPWHRAGAVDVGRNVWQQARWQWRRHGTAAVLAIDARSPLNDMLQRPRWLPSTEITIVVRSAVPPAPDRLLDPWL